MGVKTSFNIGDKVSHKAIIDALKCGNMGGMRKLEKTNTLLLISDYTKRLYHDKWIWSTSLYVSA